MVYHDDNHGAYEIRGPEDLEFFRQVQRESVRKRCRGCGRTVRLKPQYAYCSRCADLREQGCDLEDTIDDEEVRSYAIF